MKIGAYLDRIHFQGDVEPTLETLVGLHQAHLLNISYENLDIHLGRTLPLDEQAMFDKIVTWRRGGWCYEMNGLFAWALRQLGFSVTLLASAVNRAAQGDNAERNHLISLVQLDRPYLVDVGFGNGFLRPLPLEPGRYQQGFLDYKLDYDGQRWQFTNHAYGGPGYDFTLEPRQLPDFADTCHYLQTSPESGFVRVVVCHRFLRGSLISLRGLVLRTISEAGAYDETIEDEAAYRRVLKERFDLHLPDAEQSKLWEIARRKHQEFLQQQGS
jgi:N-hydroxyarylamine O-acetyltransferase